MSGKVVCDDCGETIEAQDPVRCADCIEVNQAEASELRELHRGPRWTCAGCGSSEKFNSVKYDTPGEPIEYDMECDACGCLDIRESASEAASALGDRLESMISNFDTSQAKCAELEAALSRSEARLEEQRKEYERANQKAEGEAVSAYRLLLAENRKLREALEDFMRAARAIALNCGQDGRITMDMTGYNVLHGAARRAEAALAPSPSPTLAPRMIPVLPVDEEADARFEELMAKQPKPTKRPLPAPAPGVAGDRYHGPCICPDCTSVEPLRARLRSAREVVEALSGALEDMLGSHWNLYLSQFGEESSPDDDIVRRDANHALAKSAEWLKEGEK